MPRYENLRNLEFHEFLMLLVEDLPIFGSPVLLPEAKALWEVLRHRTNPGTNHLFPAWHQWQTPVMRRAAPERWGYFWGGWVSSARPEQMPLPSGAQWVRLAVTLMTTPHVVNAIDLRLFNAYPDGGARPVFVILTPGPTDYELSGTIGQAPSLQSHIEICPSFGEDCKEDLFVVLMAYLEGPASVFPSLENPPPHKCGVCHVPF